MGVSRQPPAPAEDERLQRLDGRSQIDNKTRFPITVILGPEHAGRLAHKQSGLFL